MLLRVLGMLGVPVLGVDWHVLGVLQQQSTAAPAAGGMAPPM
jgi:hypothetical protein